jgi:hypothetical protein
MGLSAPKTSFSKLLSVISFAKFAIIEISYVLHVNYSETLLTAQNRHSKTPAPYQIIPRYPIT